MNYYEIITTEIFRVYWILEIYLENKEIFKIIKSPAFFEFLMVSGLENPC